MAVASARAQVDQSVDVQQVQVIQAEAAQLVEQQDGVLVLVTGAPKYSPAVLLVVKDEPNKYLEVHPAVNPFPPQVVKPFEPGKYLVAGPPGKYWVSVRGGEYPHWIEVEIVGSGDSPTPPDQPTEPIDVERVKQWVSENKPNDARTAQALAKAYEAAAAEMTESMSLDAARLVVVNARRSALIGLGDRQSDWSKFVQGLDRVVREATGDSVVRYKAVILAVAEALK